MTYLTDLEDARDNIATQLKDMTANAKPSYSVDGQSFSWTEHFNSLTAALKSLDSTISTAEPYEVSSVGYN